MTAAQFLDLLRRSQLAVEEELREFLTLPADGEQLAAAMVEAGLLTKWQTEKLLAGKFKGFMLGDYSLLDHYRKTAISQEYLAEHTLMKHKVVLTVPPPQLMDSPGFLERFRRESGNGEFHREGSGYYLVREYSEDDEGRD